MSAPPVVASAPPSAIVVPGVTGHLSRYGGILIAAGRPTRFGKTGLSLVRPLLDPLVAYHAQIGQPPCPAGASLGPLPPGVEAVDQRGDRGLEPGGVTVRAGGHHPFTITSAPTEPDLRFSIKALGDFTTQLPQRARPGTPVTIHGPFGRLDHTTGTPTQVWIAGGIGITPFLAWMRALDDRPLRGPVHLYYCLRSRRGDPFIPELDAIAAGHPDLTVSIIASDRGAHLTAEDVIADHRRDLADLTVYLCGPTRLQTDLRHELRNAGIPGRQIRSEHLTWR